jgi:hypothetical protein
MTASDMNTYVSANMDVANLQHLEFTATGTISSGFAAARFRVPYPLTVNSALLSVETASTSGSVILDVYRSTAENLTSTSTLFDSMFSTAAGITLTSGKSWTTAAVVPSITSLSSGDVLLVKATTATGSTAVSDVKLILSVSGA